MKQMRYLCFIIIVLIGGTLSLTASNIRIDGPVEVVGVTPQGIATLRFTVKWDSTWRDEFNYDAAYVFLKYKRNQQGEAWHHVFLKGGTVDLYHNPVGDYDMWLSSSATAAKNEGIFVFPKRKRTGNAAIEVEVTWDINSGDSKVSLADMAENKVFFSAHAVEMVYTPRGAFRIGDCLSKATFKNNRLSLPERYDIVSEEYDITTLAQNQTNPPSFAANHVNDPSATTSNSWVGDGAAGQYWRVDFGIKNGRLLDAGVQRRKVKYIAVESIEGRVPARWTLQASNDAQSWNTLYTGTAKDWAVGSARTYPATHAIDILNDQAFRYYQIYIPETALTTLVIKNIAMSEENLKLVLDNSVPVTAPTTIMSDKSGLYADDGDENWEGITSADYPNGYPAFYAMKYELSQEQYVAFLNKLTKKQQQARTCGILLERMEEGDYVFGTERKRPNNRNGIILAKRSIQNSPYVFACNLTYQDAANGWGAAQVNDGQGIACNYLCAEDMLAYACWTGLRPLTEMEFEKMGRPPYPAAPVRKAYAWNSTEKTDAKGLIEVGKRTERVADGFVNTAASDIGGPIRCGAFATGRTSMGDAGASFWGFMEMSGNLAELYYNVDTYGRTFCGIRPQHHGNGKIKADGEADVFKNIWPVHHDAFCLRGGSFADNLQTISDRTRAKGVYENMIINKRDSSIGFRLGRTAPIVSGNSVIRLENGLTTEDTICSSSKYTITGERPAEVAEAYSMTWFVSENEGKTWDLIDGEDDCDLSVENLRNVNLGADVLKSYWYKRSVFGGLADAVSNIVKVKVLNSNVLLNTVRDTVDIYNHSGGVSLSVKLEADIKWLYRDNKLEPEYSFEGGKQQWMYFSYSDFGVGSQKEGIRKVVMDATIMKTCRQTDTVYVYLKEEPQAREGNQFVCGDYMVDRREGQTQMYKTVSIGGKCWMAENLRYAKAGVCYNGNVANCLIYGRLYAWSEAAAVCPSGWHLPSSAEWTQLPGLAGNISALKSSLNYWTTVNDAAIGSNNSRFSALPAGLYSGSHQKLGQSAWWWTSNSGVYATLSSNVDFSVTSGTYNASVYMSVRCIKD